MLCGPAASPSDNVALSSEPSLSLCCFSSPVLTGERGASMDGRGAVADGGGLSTPGDPSRSDSTSPPPPPGLRADVGEDCALCAMSAGRGFARASTLACASSRREETLGVAGKSSSSALAASASDSLRIGWTLLLRELLGGDTAPAPDASVAMSYSKCAAAERAAGGEDSFPCTDGRLSEGSGGRDAGCGGGGESRAASLDEADAAGAATVECAGVTDGGGEM